MKKFVLIIMLFIILAALCSCGQTTEIRTVTHMNGVITETILTENYITETVIPEVVTWENVTVESWS